MNLNLLKRVRGGALMGLGYMLSPLSWWNDLFFNLPIALVFGYGVSWLWPQGFIPGTVIGYWLSNVVGMVMMQFGAMDVFWQDEQRQTTRDVLIGLGGATLYTVVIAALLYCQVLTVPAFLTDLQP